MAFSLPPQNSEDRKRRAAAPPRRPFSNDLQEAAGGHRADN